MPLENPNVAPRGTPLPSGWFEKIMTEHCVLIDTNVYRSTLLLRTGLGPALLHIIYRGGARLGMPEVIADEIRKQLLIAGRQQLLQLNAGSRNPGDYGAASALYCSSLC